MISPTHTISPEWQNENALRAYPIEDDAPAAAVLPAWFLSDMKVTCPSRYLKVFVSSAYLSDTLVSVGISGMTSGGIVVGLLARTVTRDELEPYRTYSMDRLSSDASGAIAFGEVPAGATPFRLTFSAKEVEVEPGVTEYEVDSPLVESAIVRVDVPGVSRIVDPYHGTEATGIIDLSGNSEFRTSVDPDAPQTIVFTLADTYRDITTSVCDATPSRDACGDTPVKSINGVTPDENGTITLRFR
jgi:hypothetical protein